MTDVTVSTPAEEDALDAVDEQLIRQLTDRARAEGLQLTGEGGLLTRLTKTVIESALEGELDDHLGYAKHDPAGRNGQNSRNGRRGKSVLTEVGPVEIAVPRDRDGSFEPKLVGKHQRRLSGVEDLVISLSAKGLTTGEIAAHLAEVYGAQVSKQTISAITDRVLEGMAEWQSRPLDAVYPVLFIDCVNVKIRDGNVANRPIYVALAVTVTGTRDILGLWAGEHGDGEGAKYWLRVLSEIKNRGVGRRVPGGLRRAQGPAGGDRDRVAGRDHPNVCGPPAAELVSLRVEAGLVGDRQDLKPVYTAPSEQAALEAFLTFTENVGAALPGDHQAVGERVAGVCAVPAVRHRDSHRGVHDQRHRVDQRPHPQSGQRPRSLPHRAGRAQMRLSGDHESRSERHRAETLVQPLEKRAERLRDHLRRTPVRRTEITQRETTQEDQLHQDLDSPCRSTLTFAAVRAAVWPGGARGIRRLRGYEVDVWATAVG